MTFDHTAFECLTRCEAEWFYRHERHLTSATESRAAFFGQIVHIGADVFYETDDVAAAQAATLAAWEKAPSFGDEGAVKPDFRTAMFASAIVALYAARWPRATRGYDIVMNERYLENPDTGECGIVDRVVRRVADDQLYVLDLKTSAWSASAGYWKQWHNSQQAAIYLDLAERELKEPISGFWCDHVYLSSRKAGPELADFTQYGPVSYSLAKRVELRSQRAQWQDRAKALRLTVAAGVPPLQSTRSCFRFNSQCGFLNYCTADPLDREPMISLDLAVGKLIEKPWTPSQRDEK